MHISSNYLLFSFNFSDDISPATKNSDWEIPCTRSLLFLSPSLLLSMMRQNRSLFFFLSRSKLQSNDLLNLLSASSIPLDLSWMLIIFFIYFFQIDFIKRSKSSKSEMSMLRGIRLESRVIFLLTEGEPSRLTHTDHSSRTASTPENTVILPLLKIVEQVLLITQAYFLWRILYRG